MKQHFTIEQAMKKADRMVKIPSRILMAICFLTGIFCFHTIIPNWIFIIFLSLMLASLIKSLFQTILSIRWQLSTFTNVTDIHGLQKAALTEEMIIDEDSLLFPLGIWSPADRQKLNTIKDRLQTDYSFIDDPSIPSEMPMYRAAYILIIVGGLTLLFGTLWSLFMQAWSGCFILSAGLLLIALNYLLCRYYRSLPPLFILSNEGITLPGKGLISWKNIRHEVVEHNTIGKNRHYLFSFSHPYGTTAIRVHDMQIKVRQLNHYIHIYHTRYLIAGG